jgi:hypothetical protein
MERTASLARELVVVPKAEVGKRHRKHERDRNKIRGQSSIFLGRYFEKRVQEPSVVLFERL